MADSAWYGWLVGGGGVLALALGALAARARDPDETGARQRRVLAVVFGLVGLVAASILVFVGGAERWLWVAAILPGYFGIQHGINTAIFKNPRFFDGSQQPNYDRVTPRVAKVLKHSIAQERRYYSTASLTLRFVLPSLVLFIATMTVGYTFLSPPAPYAASLDHRFVAGAPLGALGAYLYVVLFLGGRAMRGDVTPASLIWATVTIIGGPLFAGVLQMLVASDGKGLAEPGWTNLAIPFAAGFSVRVTVEFVEAMIRRMFLPRAADPRSESLQRIRGITHEIEERLIEEGVTDVANLANANPYRLRRNTRFDKRQIMSWIDEALLMTYLPNAWLALEADGITGAMDLAWYVDDVGGDAVVREVVRRAPVAQGASPTLSPGAASLIKLAERNKLDATALAEVMLRMYNDAQVQLIWGLYQLEDGDTGDGDPLFDRFTPQSAEADPGSERRGPPSRSAIDLAELRERIYEDNQQLFLIHSWRRSAVPKQVADIVIRIAEHKGGPLSAGKVRRVSYYLGEYFGGEPFVKENAKDSFSLEVSAYGPMLCVARVELASDAPPIMLHRYIDFDVPGATDGRPA